MPHVRELANEILDQIKDEGHIDFVEQFAIHVPLIIICELMGLNPEQRMAMYRWSDDMMAGDGHTGGPALDAAAVAFGEFAMMCLELIEARRAEPQNDLISILTQAFDEAPWPKSTRRSRAHRGALEAKRARDEETHGAHLSDDELLGFLTVLLVAGNETTRNAISGGLLALSLFPEQRRMMVDNLDIDDFMDCAVDELVRFVSPVLGFIRTVTTDHTYRNTDLQRATGCSCCTPRPTATTTCSTPRTSSTCSATEPAPCLRHRPALLPRCQPRPHGGQARVPGAAQALPGDRDRRRRSVRPWRIVPRDRAAICRRPPAAVRSPTERPPTDGRTPARDRSDVTATTRPNQRERILDVAPR
jgi:hypothetical protein